MSATPTEMKVPASFKEMFSFNSAVMGCGQSSLLLVTREWGGMGYPVESLKGYIIGAPCFQHSLLNQQ